MRAWLLAVFAALSCLASATARAQSCEALRPTDPGGTNGLAYGEAIVISGDSPSGRVRVFFANSGPHATSMAVAEAALEAADRALERYDELGFLPVIPDTGSPCPSDGGGDQIDIYLLNFTAADGQAVADHCVVEAGVRRCSGFVLVENDFRGGGYADATEGMRTVVPHEIFHLIQNAYDTNIDRFWAEGTAQWAAKRVFPELGDLERFLPVYFDNPARPLDGAAGVASSFLYATAIWPLFLSERFDDDLIRRIFTRIGAGTKVFPATDAELVASGSGLGPEFLQFAAYNAATGSRALEGVGYADAASYPEVPVMDFNAELGTSIEGVGSGLSSSYYALRVNAARKLSLDAEPARIGAAFVPLEDGVARVDLQRALPTVVESDGILLIAGQSAAKTDAPFSVAIGSTGEGSGLSESSCSIGRARPIGTEGGAGLWGVALFGALLVLASRRNGLAKSVAPARVTAPRTDRCSCHLAHAGSACPLAVRC